MKKKTKLTDIYDNCMGNGKFELGEDIDSQLYIDSRERYDYLNYQTECLKKRNPKYTDYLKNKEPN